MRTAVGILAILTTTSAFAATKTWSGAGANTNWTTAGNWNAAVAAGDDLVFPDGISTGTTNGNNFAAGTAFNSITFPKNGTGNQSYTINGFSITLGSGGIADSDTMGTRTLNIGIQLTTNTTVNAAGSYLVLNGVLSGAFGLTKAGAGALQISGANTYTGTTTVNAGKLYVNGATAVVGPVVVTGGELGISSGATVGTIALNGGTLAPGDGGLGTGASGNLSFSSAGTLQVGIYGTMAGSYSHLDVTGTIALGDAMLSVTGGYAPAPGESWVIFANDGTDAITGTFAGVPEGATVMLNATPIRVSYKGGDGNDLVLTALNPVTAGLTSSKTGPAVATEPVTFTATVSGAGAPSGMVTFLDGDATIGTAMINSGTAAFTTALLAVGDHVIGAQYAGDANNGGFSIVVDQAVTIATSTVALSANSGGTGLSAQVMAVAPATGVPGGMVSLLEGDTVIATQAVSSGGVASFDAAAIGIGMHTLSAKYEGDDRFSGSTSASVTVDVTEANDGGTGTDGGELTMKDEGGCSHAGRGGPTGLLSALFLLGALVTLARRRAKRG